MGLLKKPNDKIWIIIFFFNDLFPLWQYSAFEPNVQLFSIRYIDLSNNRMSGTLSGLRLGKDFQTWFD